MYYVEDVKIIKGSACFRYDNEDILVADKNDWNRCIPAFSEMSGALEMIQLAIEQGRIENAKLIDNTDGVAIFSNMATIHDLPENILDYFSAVKYLREKIV